MLISLIKDILTAPKAVKPVERKLGAKSVLNVGGGSKSTPIPDYFAGWQHDLLDIDARGAPDIVCDARELATLPGAPRRPFAPDSRRAAPPFDFILPVDAPVIDGLGQVSASGIRARGTTFAARAGMPVLVPADGILIFAGPYRRHDGIAIIDHGKGWMSLLVGVRPTAAKGARVARGAVLGRALGPVTLELSIEGRPQSAVLTASSSQSLSINVNGG